MSTHWAALLDIKAKQDTGEVVPDSDYINLPVGKTHCNTPEHGFWNLNFHYNLHAAADIATCATALEDELLRFLLVADIKNLRLFNQVLLVNMSATFAYYIRSFTGYDYGSAADNDGYGTKMQEYAYAKASAKEKFILDAIDFIRTYDKMYLTRLNSQVCPELFKRLSSSTKYD